MTEQGRAFKGVWIPADIWLNGKLTIHEKFILAEIDSFCSHYESCYASNEHFAKFIGLSTRRVKDIIKGLEDKGFIEREIIYKEHSKEVAKRLLRLHHPSCRILHEGGAESCPTPSAESCPENNTSMNNTKEGIYKRNSSKTQKDVEYEGLFNIFYKAYPKKKDKTKAFNAFKKLKPDQALLDKILTSLEWQKQQDDWKKDGGQYVPYPATYLNGRRWEDERETVVSQEEDYYASADGFWVKG